MKFDGAIIHSQRDEYGLIQIVENRVTRKLFFDSAVEQSCLYLNAPLQLNFEYQQQIVDSVSEKLKKHLSKNQSPRLLMLGMGGGSIASHLFHSQPQLQITVVELRQAVIDCAYQYFHLPDEPEIEVLHDNGITFIAENEFPYDIVIIDIFDAHGLPSELSDSDFQHNLWRNIHSGGSLLFNLWFEWDKTNCQGKPITTQETQKVVNYWQQFADDNSDCTVKRYNIQSSQNLILEVQKS